MPINIKSKVGRSKLSTRREPYWSRIRTGLFIGFRKLPVGDGTWIARRQTDDGKKQYHSLGSLIDDGRDKAYDSAVATANEWAYGLEHGVANKAMTVAEACRSYIDDRRMRKLPENAKDAEVRFKRLVYGNRIGRIPLAKLNTTNVRTWLNAQIDVEDDGDGEDIRRARDTANRNLTILKAALNHALRDRLVTTDAGWKTVTAFEKVSRRREGFLTRDQRTELLDACPGDLRHLVMAMLLTGARPGELTKATIKDFDQEQGTITLNGKTGFRIATLSTQASKYFMEISKGKIGNAPLIARQHGGKWKKNSWIKLFKDAVIKAGLPIDTVLYTLRHVAITEMINNGMDSFVVAKLAGTSTAMIDKHYGQLKHDNTRAKLDKIQMI